MRSWWLPLSTLALMMGGCAGEAPAAGAEPAVEPEPFDPWAGSDRVEVAAFHFDGTEADTPACTNGGAGTTAPEFPRDEHVHPGTDHLELTVSAEATMTGIQVGYRHGDGEDYTWLPVVFASSETFTIPVEESQWEATEPPQEDELEFEGEGFQWAFNHRINLPGPAAQDCWTGAGTGRFDVTVKAVKASG